MPELQSSKESISRSKGLQEQEETGMKFDSSDTAIPEPSNTHPEGKLPTERSLPNNPAHL